MSITLALQTALSGIQAQQSALQVAANNIANVNTIGYTRKVADFQSRTLVNEGAGVEIGNISRKVDEFLISQLRDQESVVGALSVRDRFLSIVQGFFGPPNSSATLTGGISEFNTALETLAVSPESASSRFNAVNEARTLTAQFRSLSDLVQDLRLDAELDIDQAVGRVDTKLKEIADLNLKIARAAAQNEPTGDLRDQRDRALAAVAEEMDIQVVETSDSQVVIFTGKGRTLLTLAVPQDITHNAVAQMSPSIYYTDPSDPGYPGVVIGIFVGPEAVDGRNDITNDIIRGRLKGLIELRDETLPNLQKEIDTLGNTLMTQFNALHNKGTAQPPPNSHTGIHSFTSTDVFSATGSVRVALLNQSDGTVVSSTDLALGALTTVDAARLAIDGITGVTATLDTNGKLVVSADSASQGIAINELTSAATVIGSETRGFSHYFGLNDFFVAPTDVTQYDDFLSAKQASSTSQLGITGTLTFAGAFGSTTVGYATSDTLLEGLAANINADATLIAANTTATVFSDGGSRRLRISDAEGNNTLITDSGTFLTSFQLTPEETSVARVLDVNAAIVNNPDLIARGTLSSGTLVAGDDGITVGDATNANTLAGLFSNDQNFRSSGSIAATTTTFTRFASQVLSLQASLASNARNDFAFQEEFQLTLNSRASAQSGVNIDEELANLVLLEQAFSASARVAQVAADLLQVLLDEVR